MAKNQARKPEKGEGFPISNGPNKDAKTGQFVPGNQAAKGVTTRKTVALLRKAALDSASPEMARKAMLKLYELGMQGDVKALCEWLGRIGMKPEMIELDAQLEEIAVHIKRYQFPDPMVEEAPPLLEAVDDEDDEPEERDAEVA